MLYHMLSRYFQMKGSKEGKMAAQPQTVVRNFRSELFPFVSFDRHRRECLERSGLSLTRIY